MPLGRKIALVIAYLHVLESVTLNVLLPFARAGNFRNFEGFPGILGYIVFSAPFVLFIAAIVAPFVWFTWKPLQKSAVYYVHTGVMIISTIIVIWEVVSLF